METDPGAFERLVADALDQIPERLGRMMENVVVMVEDWPTPNSSTAAGAPCSGFIRESTSPAGRRSPTPG